MRAISPSHVVVPGAWQTPAGGRGLGAVIIAAAALAVALLAVAAVLVGQVFDHGAGPIRVGMVATVTLIGALITAVTARYEGVSPWAQAAVVLAAVMAGLAVVLAAMWQVVHAHHPLVAELYPLTDVAATYALRAGAVVLVAALVLGRGSTVTPRWLTAIAALAIADVLATALWLPVYAASTSQSAELTAAFVRATLVPALAPPLVVAAIIAGVATWRPGWLRAARWPLAAITGWLVMVAIGAIDLGGTHEDHAAQLYTQYVPVLIGGWWFAIMTIVAVALAHIRGLRRARRAQRSAAIQRGTVVVEAPASTTVATLHHRGWLAGLAPQCQGFTLRTAHGDLAVPAGGDVVSPTPPWAAQAGTGAIVPALGDGDEVEVAGFTTATTGEGPFRMTTRPVLGTRGAIVFTARRRDEPVGRDLVLRVWQPCAVLLAASVAAALPALMGLLK
ncbi:MAG: hypothetical protein IPL61_29175 [Myxococcales bacterium]|nr:hypothetical protein [Myxococcales bacterium]